MFEGKLNDGDTSLTAKWNPVCLCCRWNEHFSLWCTDCLISLCLPWFGVEGFVQTAGESDWFVGAGDLIGRIRRSCGDEQTTADKPNLDSSWWRLLTHKLASVRCRRSTASCWCSWLQINMIWILTVKDNHDYILYITTIIEWYERVVRLTEMTTG